jgi:hypothetical protein
MEPYKVLFIADTRNWLQGLMLSTLQEVKTLNTCITAHFGACLEQHLSNLITSGNTVFRCACQLPRDASICHAP